ncbi:MAG: DUF512 domain-containing protein [Lachnospiraceae bacterium]|nr:DUF512 domain-containing protein [Lachnospiraceae bacterium]
MRGHKISTVEEGSIAWEMGVEPGMYLVSVNGEEIEDSFDYSYMMWARQLDIVIGEENGDETLLEIDKDEDEDFGIGFESPLMNGYRSCSNRCIFCFIDQMPKGMRETLYFKDDDSRLSFLQGNYVTLTNMSDHDIERIIKYRMEPINISVQTTNPELRVSMLRNRFAGSSLEKMKILKDAGIAMNGQIVLCKGWNDGDELRRTISDLTAYLPELRSVSVVPVGLSRFRDGLEPLEPFTGEDACRVIDEIESWQQIIYERLASSYVPSEDEDPFSDEALKKGAPRHFIHASDEWYVMAGRELPPASSYDGFIQYENGVGMLRLLMEETGSALTFYRKEAEEGRLKITGRRCVTDICGRLAAPYIESLSGMISEAFPGTKMRVVPIRNDFFGERITVTGLLTGQDIIKQLRGLRDSGEDLGEELLLPVCTLRRGENVFLDDMTTADLEAALEMPVRVVGESGDDLVRAQLGLPEAEDAVKSRPYEADGSEQLPVI